MNQMQSPAGVSRRSILRAAGALVVSVGMPVGLDTVLAINAAAAQGSKPPLVPNELDSFIAIDGEGNVSAFFGKMDMGQGLTTAIGQIVAEELDVPFNRVRVIMGDTGTTVDQGGASSSNGVSAGGRQMRMAAAEARRVLVEMAAAKFGVPADSLIVVDGIIRLRKSDDDAARSVSYANLIGGKYFNTQLEWNKQLGNNLYAPGKAKPKAVADYQIVGKPIAREDVAPKVYAQQDFVTDIKRPGMVHARVLRPPVAGASVVSTDESSIKDIAGARVVREKDLVAVIADKEWDAIKASQALKIEWSSARPAFLASPDQVYEHIRKAPVAKSQIEPGTGNVDEAFKTAARVIEAEYEWPFQSHASMGPACAVAEVTADGATVWTGSQKPHRVAAGVAGILGLPLAKVRAIWVVGPGSYGRNDAGDAASEAAMLSKLIGRPVRLQYTREQGTAWDPKGPASVHRARAAVDASGNVVAYEFMSRGFSRLDVDSGEAHPKDTLAGHFLGVPLKPEPAFNVPSESYGFPSKRLGWETIPAFLDRASPLRTSHLRDPLGPQLHFASESFMDEVAAAIGADPVEFRLRYVRNPRDAAVIKGAAEGHGWETRTSPNRQQQGPKLVGRGISYAERNGTRSAVVAEVEVDRETGKVWARRFTVAHDCGLIINPQGLRQTIEGNIVQGLSRTLWEEVQFDEKAVTSVDWETYPILDIVDAPEAIEVVLINRPDIPPSGAGEGAIRPIAGAVANAIFDATGIRIRRAPFTPERVKAALSA
jgi:CO/xanthine dehydrogenase Mo-binding subunit